MAFTPMSAVYLLDTPLDNTNKNQLSFSSANAQYIYFISRVKHSFDYVTYQRKDKSIKVNAHLDDLWNVNYIMYQNKNFTNKWFYAFITKMEYVSDNVTEIFIETDVFQTWLFDTTIKPSFVVREHVKNDAIGSNLVAENLEYGEYKPSAYEQVGKMGGKWNILAVSDNEPMGDDEKIGNRYGSVVSGLTYYPFPNTTQGINWLKDTVALYDEAGKPEALEIIFTVPRVAISPTVDSGHWLLGKPLDNNDLYGMELFNLTTKPKTIDGYTPKNNKLLTYPYCLLYISNPTGQGAEYRYEDFKNDDVRFTLTASPSPNLTTMLYPNDYKGSTASYDYGLPLQGFPLGSWNSDTYTAWFAQNSVGLGVSMVGSMATIIGGIATGNMIAVGGGALAVANQLSQITKASIQPDQSKGHNSSGSARYSENTLDYFYSKLTIKSEFAKRIDDYFTMYGYKVNALKVPETKSRTNWNFIQTIDINIEGAIPSEDMAKLKNIYNEGVTLWHNPSNFLNYSANNNII